MPDSSRGCHGRWHSRFLVLSSNPPWRFGRGRIATYWRRSRPCITAPIATRLPAPANTPAQWRKNDRNLAKSSVGTQSMNQIPLYPLRFDPIYQYRLWGGRRLSDLLSAPLPGDGPIGEAWVLSDRDDHQSQVANGPLKGRTIGELMGQFHVQLMGKLAPRFHRFPLLLKFLDAREMLSVQVHPSDAYPDLIPVGETGKTEAWVVIEAEKISRIYAGIKPDRTVDDLRLSLVNGTLADQLVRIVPKPGDAVFIPAGTVHIL